MLDFRNDLTRQRLAKSVEFSYRAMEPFRNLSKSLLEEYVGPGYGESKVRFDMYLNLMNQVVDAYVMMCAANRPRVMLSTPHQQLRPFSKKFEIALNNLLAEIRIDATCREWLINAIISGLGIVRVHMANSHLVEIEQDVWMDTGIPFASVISLDDAVIDMTSKKWGQHKYVGDMYRIPHEDLLNGPYDQEIAKEIRPTSKFVTDAERMEQISRGTLTDDDEFEPMVDLCDIYVTRTRKIYTFAVDQRSTFEIKHPPLKEEEWEGGEAGPYHMLGFIHVPDNIMPASMADQLSSLSRFINNSMRKLTKQARNQKTVHAYTPAGADGAERIRKAGDDDWVKVNAIEEIAEIKSGGVDPGTMQMMLNSIDLFDRMAGNLTAMLGLGRQASTVGQEQLIHSASGQKPQQMQTQYVDACRLLFKDLGHLLWNDNFREIPAQYELPGTGGITVDMTWHPLDREGSFMDYNFDVDIFSLPNKSPGERMQAITQVVTQVFGPLLPFLQQQGGNLDMAVLADLMASMMFEPRIRDLIKFNGMALPYDQQPSTPMRKPPTSTREYVRRNVSEGNSATKSMAEGWSSAAQSAS